MKNKLLLAASVSVIFHSFIFLIPVFEKITEKEEDFINYSVSLSPPETEQPVASRDKEESLREYTDSRETERPAAEDPSDTERSEEPQSATDNKNTASGEEGGSEVNTGTGKTDLPVLKEEYVDYEAILDKINSEIAENIVYPRAARRNNIEGIVTLSFNVNKNGGISGLSVFNSSGYRILDNAAVDLLEEISPFGINLTEDINLKVNIVYELER
jgi:periplasmic protein TonB